MINGLKGPVELERLFKEEPGLLLLHAAWLENEIAKTRQEALREGMELAAEEADMHVCDDPRYCHCSSKIYKAILDRLAREGVK